MLVDNNYTVPNCDCVLDHHSLLSLSTALESDLSRRSQSRFKNDVLKLAKKLKLHGWDTISPSFCSSNINVRKLSGKSGKCDMETRIDWKLKEQPQIRYTLFRRTMPQMGNVAEMIAPIPTYLCKCREPYPRKSLETL